MFMYPPSFEFKKVPGAVKYRFVAIDDLQREHVMEDAEPTAFLTPMWGKIPARGLVTVICDGVDAKGNVCGRAGMRRFWKAAPFTPGGYKPAPRSYAEAAAKACDFIWSLPNTRHLLEKGEPLPKDFQGGAVFHAGPVALKNEDGSWRTNSRYLNRAAALVM